MRKYSRMFVNYIQTAVEFKMDILVMLIESLVSVFGGLVLWIAIFRNTQNIGGYTSTGTIIYFLLLPVINFITFTNIADDLGDQIRLGEFSSFLIKPIELWRTQFVKMISEKIGFLSFVLPIYCFVLFIVFRSFISLDEIKFSPFAAVIFVVLGMILNFIIDMTIAPLAFWFDEVWSFKHLKKICGLILGGMAFPITIASGAYRQIIDWSPFKFVIYIPVAFFTGKLSSSDIIQNLVQVSAWIFIFAILGRLIFYLGIKNYSANGN